MLDVVPPVVRNGGRGCLYTAEPTDGRSTDRRPSVMFTFNAIARQSINAGGAVSPKGIYRHVVSASQIWVPERKNYVPSIIKAQCPEGYLPP